jgi:putative Mn2+ efflux pump MntP
MVWMESLFSAFSLSLDAFAASLCLGAGAARGTRSAALRMALACGAFQFIMPLAGGVLGTYSLEYISSFDHWTAFALLTLVGGNMIRESFGEEKREFRAGGAGGKNILYLALATSIDALAVGVGFSVVQKPILRLAAAAGIVTALLCFAGVKAGRLTGHRLGRRASLAGGLALILIGLNILRLHLWS